MDGPDLGSVARLGEFFALPPADDSWLPITGLVTDAATLRDYAARTRSAIAAGFPVEESRIPHRAAASSLHLAIAARLLSPVVGAAACFDAIPLLTSKSLFWQRSSNHRPTLGAAGVEWVSVGDPGGAARAITDSLILEVVGPFNETMRRATSLSPQVMWGNIASAANGAVTALTRLRPSAQRRGREVVRGLLVDDPLAGAAEFVDDRFVRRNCCLFYQVPGGGYCSDCVLVGS